MKCSLKTWVWIVLWYLESKGYMDQAKLKNPNGFLEILIKDRRMFQSNRKKCPHEQIMNALVMVFNLKTELKKTVTRNMICIKRRKFIKHVSLGE